MSKNTKKTPAEKVKIVEESKLVGSIETARKHGISNKTLVDWQVQFDAGGLEQLVRFKIKVLMFSFICIK